MGSVVSGESLATISADRFKAVIFDLDGVITKTADLHAEAWKNTFDPLLQARGQPIFDITSDYLKYVDGLPRLEGVKSFLKSRGIHLPTGNPSDLPEQDTLHGLANRKNPIFVSLLQEKGVQIFDSTVALINILRREEIKIAVASASKNCSAILEASHLLGLFDVKVDGWDIQRLHLRGKPDPDLFLEAARQLGVSPEEAVVIEDAEAGVAAGRAGGFGLVIGVDRAQHAQALYQHGAHAVVPDLAFVSVATCLTPPPVEERHSWNLVYTRYKPAEEGIREALCALGNGYVVTRGAASESRDDGVHYPGTYLAGCYNRLSTDILEKSVAIDDLVNLPNWLPIQFRLEDGPWISLDSIELLYFRQELELRHGILHRHFRVVDPQGRRTSVVEKRLVHMKQAHVAAQEYVLRPENWSGNLSIKTALDGCVINNNVRAYRVFNNRHLQPLETKLIDPQTILLKVQTNQSGIQVVQVARTRLYKNNRAIQPQRETAESAAYIEQIIPVDLQAGDELVVEKIRQIYSSRDPAVSDSEREALEDLSMTPGFQELQHSHMRVWKHLWNWFDIELESTDKEAGRHHPALILRLHTFHILQTASPWSMGLDVDIPARGWHGEGYRGHIFWDSLFVFGYLNFRFPELTKSLLKYRHWRLDEARRLARAAGYQGAMFPWESASCGDEEPPRFSYDLFCQSWYPERTYLERHVNAAIVYNLWRYYQLTEDTEFLYDQAAEIILEVARFWASIATYNRHRDRYEICGVVGPDEYHDQYPESETLGINNNAYTNLTATWCLCRALELLEILPAEIRDALCDILRITPSELSLWDRISRKLYVPFISATVLSQFEGYEKLREVDWSCFQARELYARADQVRCYQISKQADVVMLFYLYPEEEFQALLERLDYPFHPDLIKDSIAYYQERTTHASTLSRVVYAAVTARIDPSESWRLYKELLWSDVYDIQHGTTAAGVHLGAMGGSIDIVQRFYAGLDARGDTLWFAPHLPEQISRIAFRVHYRGHVLSIELTQEELKITSEETAANPIHIGFRKSTHPLSSGKSLIFPLLP
jgi:beta-phosphoglucomutase family hydrolase